MTDNLQTLLERIQKDGVQQGEQEASRIVEAAQARAKQIVREAEEAAARTRAAAEQEARNLVDHGTRSLRQAARDVILSVQAAVQDTLDRLVHSQVKAAADAETVRKMLTAIAEAYGRTLPKGSTLQIALAPEQQQAITESFLAQLAQQAKVGLEVKADRGVVGGFRVTVKGQGIEHDFSAAAIAEAIGSLLRPRLAEIVRGASQPAGGAPKA